MTAADAKAFQSQHGRTAVITGAGSPDGIGFACARSLGLQGATVIITSTTDRILAREEELRRCGIVLHSVVADLLTPEGPEMVTATAMNTTGRLDVLVNNAGSGCQWGAGHGRAAAPDDIAALA